MKKPVLYVIERRMKRKGAQWQRYDEEDGFSTKRGAEDTLKWLDENGYAGYPIATCEFRLATYARVSP
jgi:hypothetical protein